MPQIKGIQTLLDNALPAGWDAERITQWAMRDGKTYGELANMLALALSSFNQEMIDNWGWCMSLTDQDRFEYTNGGDVDEMPEITAQKKAESIKGRTIGHMIELVPYGSALGGEKRYFRDARLLSIMAGIGEIVLAGRWRFEKKLLNRWFTNTETLIGSTGYNVPFVRGSGGSVDFAPPAFDGQSFDTSHDHYLGVDSNTKGFSDVLDELAETLQHHGHGELTALVSQTDMASYLALPKWVEAVDPIIWVSDQGSGSGNRWASRQKRVYGFLGHYQGKYGLVEVRYTSRVPTGYTGMTKTYGDLNVRNGLAIRVHPDEGFGASVAPETLPNDDIPIKQLDVEFEFGAGVGRDRTNGAVAFLDSSGTWTNPTIT